MKTVRLLAMYLGTVVLGSALAAPWIYWGCQWLGAQSAAFEWLHTAKFYEVLNRVLMLSALAGSFILLVSQKSLSRRTLGLERSPRMALHLVVGATVAIISVMVVLVLGLVVGALEWDWDLTPKAIGVVTLVNLVAAIVIAVLEEIFFRGCLLGWLRQQMPALAALMVVTLFYAITHFMDPPRSAKFLEVNWLSGFTMLGHYAANLADKTRWVPQFVMLVLIGLTLGWCFLRTSRLYLSIGLHAGWVFAGKTLTFLTESNEATHNWLFGAGRLIGSPITILAVGSVFVLMLWMCNQPILRSERSTP